VVSLQTRELHIAKVCGCGLTDQTLLQSAHLLTDTTRAWARHCCAGHPRRSPPAAAAIIGLNRKGVEYRSNNANWPYVRAFQMTVPEIIIAILYCLCEMCVLMHDIVLSLGVEISQGR